MKNKGRKHKAGHNSELRGICDTKSTIVQLTRPVKSMSSKGMAVGRFDKKKWTKRVRGYSKLQTKKVFSNDTE